MTFKIENHSLEDFIIYWAKKYTYANGEKYTDNIGKPLSQESRQELFEWKNGSKMSEQKFKSVDTNYPLAFSDNEDDQKYRYLNHEQNGGPIWNIFYLHCLNQERWPIFDQHTFRAMSWLKTGEIQEIEDEKDIYKVYLEQYIPFLKKVFPAPLSKDRLRQIDRALFAFGKFLKTAAKYL